MMFWGWLVIGFKANCPLVGPGPIDGKHLRGGLSKGSLPVFTRVSEETAENSEWRGRQGRPEIEPGPSRLSVLSFSPPPLMVLMFWGTQTRNIW